MIQGLLSDERKILLEKCLGIIIDNEVDNIKEDDPEFAQMLLLWKNFRISISGGTELTMGETTGCGGVVGFVEELLFLNKFMSDWAGAYEGDYSYEFLESVLDVLDKQGVDIELRDAIKIKAIEEFDIADLYEDEEE
jgi:hypothetical protein